MNFDKEYWHQQRAQTDVLADDTIDKLMKSGEYEAVRQSMNQFIGATQNPAKGYPPAMQDYREATSHLPPWFDKQRVDRAQILAATYGIEGAVILLCKSLPQCYSLSKGAEVLNSTTRLVNRPEHATYPYIYRIMETLQFVDNVCTKNCFDSDGYGISTVRRVRLIHAAIRYFLLHTKDWDAEKMGRPINQEDLVLTLTTFSVSIVEGWEQLGIRLSRSDKEDFVHLWAVVAYILGIHEENIPHSFADSKKIQHEILLDQGAYSDAGRDLTLSVTKFVELISRSIIHARVTTGLMCLFLSPAVCKNVGLPSKHSERDFFDKVIVSIFRFIVWIQQKLPWLSTAIRKFTGYIVRQIIKRYAGDNPIRFVPPPSLTGGL